MEEKLYESLLAFAKKYSTELKRLNMKSIDALSTEVMGKALKSVTNDSRLSLSEKNISSALQESIRSITHSYSDLLSSYDCTHSINDSLKSMFVHFQVNALYQLTRSAQTTMIQEMTECFANARYNSLADILNQTMAKSILHAPDLAFIKTSDLLNVLGTELIVPRGFSTSLQNLSKSTAYDIAGNMKLEYDMRKNCVISSKGKIDTKGLNIICAGKELLSFGNGEIFTENELIDFCSYLSSTPMLGIASDTGKKIYDFLQELFRSGTKTIGFDKEVYYHCRSHKKGDMPFTYDQMLKAPNGLPWAGRFNQVGRSNYYFSDTRHGAEAEVKKHKAANDVLQTTTLKPVKGVKLLDLSGTLARGATFLRYLRFSITDVSDKMPREYLIPCYVSDCCKQLGFDGIKYYGSRDYSNYVVWYDGYFSSGGMCE